MALAFRIFYNCFNENNIKGGIKMELATMIQTKCREIYDENYGEGKLRTLKAIGAAMLSGAVDAAVIVYPYVLGSLILVTKVMTKNIEKEEA